mmetsp:Transcript_11685/g.16906  ORF Transcript_11685/g.16906 Transcript_11685/m.16906 type:complete len:264 (-) Transcript_11685:101-892(-)
MVYKALLKLLAATFDARDNKVSALIPQTCSLLKDIVLPLCTNPGNASELFLLLLKLLHKILTVHWRFFVTSVADNSQNSGNAAASGGIGSILGQNPLALALNGKRVIRVIDADRLNEFQLLLQIMLDSFRTPDISPATVAFVIATLRDLDKMRRLFKVEEFATLMKPTFLATMMETLLARSQPLLVEEISLLLFELANSDMDIFFSSFLPSLIGTLQISEEMKISLKGSWPDERDSSTFCASCQNFLSEYRYVMSRSVVLCSR